MAIPDADTVVGLYQPAADSYASLMDNDIQSPVYSDALSRLHAKIAKLEGAIVDVSCGSGHCGIAKVGDMRHLPDMSDGSAAGLVNFFAIHHLTDEGLRSAVDEWHRLLKPGGQLILAAWEGAGEIGYGEDSEQIALKYTASELQTILGDNGFVVDRCLVETIEEMSMDAVYIDATRVDSTANIQDLKT